MDPIQISEIALFSRTTAQAGVAQKLLWRSPDEAIDWSNDGASEGAFDAVFSASNLSFERESEYQMEIANGVIADALNVPVWGAYLTQHELGSAPAAWSFSLNVAQNGDRLARTGAIPTDDDLGNSMRNAIPNEPEIALQTEKSRAVAPHLPASFLTSEAVTDERSAVEAQRAAIAPIVPIFGSGATSVADPAVSGGGQLLPYPEGMGETLSPLAAATGPTSQQDAMLSGLRLTAVSPRVDAWGEKQVAAPQEGNPPQAPVPSEGGETSSRSGEAPALPATVATTLLPISDFSANTFGDNAIPEAMGVEKTASVVPNLGATPVVGGNLATDGHRSDSIVPQPVPTRGDQNDAPLGSPIVRSETSVSDLTAGLPLRPEGAQSSQVEPSSPESRREHARSEKLQDANLRRQDNDPNSRLPEGEALAQGEARIGPKEFDGQAGAPLRASDAVGADAKTGEGLPPLMLSAERRASLDAALISQVHHVDVSRIETARSIGQQIAAGIAMQVDRPVELTLSPEELGRVRLTLQAAGDQTMVVSVQAERHETLDLMRRHIDSLTREFREMGYSDVSFSFSQHSERGRAQDGAADQTAAETGAPTASERTIAQSLSAQLQPIRISLDSDGRGLDLRI